jgi:hypothetical protein
VADATPTPYPDLNQLLTNFVACVQEILDLNFTGAYLQGSFAGGDFDAHSDVDFIVITESVLSGEQLGRLQEMHGRLFNLPTPWAQHLEGSYFPRAVLYGPPQPQTKLWFLDNGARELTLSDHCNTIVVRRLLREKGITLAGPPPDTLLPPVPEAALKLEVLDTINAWGAEILAQPERFNNRFYQGFIVLSYCRMLHALEFGVIASKRACAQWARAALDPSWSGLIDRAWATRPDPAQSVREPADTADFAQTLQFVRYSMRVASSE